MQLYIKDAHFARQQNIISEICRLFLLNAKVHVNIFVFSEILGWSDIIILPIKSNVD
jgi:hypothetical protein